MRNVYSDLPLRNANDSGVQRQTAFRHEFCGERANGFRSAKPRRDLSIIFCEHFKRSWGSGAPVGN